MDFLTLLLSLSVLFSSWFGSFNQSLGQEITTLKSVNYAEINSPISYLDLLNNQQNKSESRSTNPSKAIEDYCFCILQNPDSKLVPDYVNPENHPIERLVAYFYIDPTSQKVKMYIPNEEKQHQIPDLHFDKNDMVIDVTNQLPWYDTIANNILRVNNTNKNFKSPVITHVTHTGYEYNENKNPSNVQIKPIQSNDALEQNIISTDTSPNALANSDDDKIDSNHGPHKHNLSIILGRPEPDIASPTQSFKDIPFDTIRDIETPEVYAHKGSPSWQLPLKIQPSNWDGPHHQKTLQKIKTWPQYYEEYWSRPNKYRKPWLPNSSKYTKKQSHHFIPDSKNPIEQSPTKDLHPRPTFWPPRPIHGIHSSKDFNALPSYPGRNVPHIGKFDAWLSNEMKCIDSLQITNAIETHEFKSFVKKTLRDHGLYLTSNGVLVNQSGIAVNLDTLKLRPVLIGNTFTYQNLISYIGGHKQISIPESPYLQFVIITLSNPNKLLGIIPLGVVYLPNQVSNQLPFEQPVNKIKKLFKGKDKHYEISPNKNDLVQGISIPIGGKQFRESDRFTVSNEKIGELLKYYETIDQGSDIAKDAFVFINEGEMPGFRIIGGGAATGSGTPLSVKGRSGRLPAISA